MIRKKLRSRRGLTLAETLTALAVFAILSVVLVQGVTAAWKVYQKAMIASEARTLQSTLTQALSNELRYADNIRQEDGKLFFDSETFGQGVSVQSSDGKIQVGGGEKAYDLLPAKAYTGGLEAEANLAYDQDAGLFTMTLTITHPLFPQEGMTSELVIRAMNPSEPENTQAPEESTT